MQPPVERVAAGTDHREIVAMLSRAFWDDPLFDFLAGDDLLREYTLLPRVFEAALRDVDTEQAEHYVVRSGRVRGFAGWLRPGAFPRTRRGALLRDLRAAALLLRVARRRAAAELLREVERRHPTEPHWYLALVATDPLFRGRGIGTSLLDPVLDRCSAEGLPAYTETQRAENVAWYGRLGFRVVDELRVRDAPPVWRLWREPSSAHSS